MKKEDELILIERIKGGETALYDKLVVEHSPRVLSVIRGVLCCREDAEEVAQDVFVKAFFSLKSFRGDCSFSTWLYRIAYNMSVSKVRKKKESFLPIDMLSIPDNSSQALAETIIEQKQQEKLLNMLIEELSAPDRFLLLSFYIHEKSISELSAITDMSESNVKVRLHRMKKKMNSMIKDKMEVSYG